MTDERSARSCREPARLRYRRAQRTPSPALDPTRAAVDAGAERRPHAEVRPVGTRDPRAGRPHVVERRAVTQGPRWEAVREVATARRRLASRLTEAGAAEGCRHEKPGGPRRAD